MMKHPKARISVLWLCVVAATGVGLWMAPYTPYQASQGVVLPTETKSAKIGQIAYASFLEASILVINEDGSSPSQLAKPRGDHLDWSPDGRKLVFSEYPTDSDSPRFRQLFILNISDGTLRQITQSKAHNFAPRWSPNGENIAFLVSEETITSIYIMNSDGSNVRKVLSYTRFDEESCCAHNLTWSPDGRKIAFISDKDAPRDANGRPVLDNIYIFDVDTVLRNAGQGSIDNLTKDIDEGCMGLYIRDVAWSPLGNQLAFRLHCGEGAKANLYVLSIRPNTGLMGPINLTRNTVVPQDGLDWSPDGNRLVFAGYPDRNLDTREILMIDISATLQMGKPKITQLTPRDGFYHSYSWPTWKPDPGAHPQPAPTKTLIPTVRPR